MYVFSLGVPGGSPADLGCAGGPVSGSEYLLVRPQQRQTVDQVEPSRPWDETVPTHPPSLSV
ncbi:hypothetical protein ACFY8B_24940 [Streptomyces sp. NPDC012751]|uniref:hypothetical protein n=1 Tax=Streptomyces sp. NPDC012751 TaxID=3364846 RepID=UPI0036B4EDE0